MSHDELRVLAVELRSLREKKEDLEAQVAEVNKRIEQVSRVEIPTIMEALDIRTVTFEGVGRVQLASDLFCSTKEGRKDDAMQWLRDCGYVDMIQETYNASSMKALIRRMMAEGTEAPDFLNVTPFTRASVVKA